MKNTPIRTLDGFKERGLLNKATPALREVAAQFSVSITPAMTDLIKTDDTADPIAAQFVPSEKELEIEEDELSDPISDKPFTPVKGIVHRYPDRLLLKLLETCPVYCRFCFRREQVGSNGTFLSEAEQNVALEYIRNHKEIWEVILSGGDPLLLSPRRLADVFAQLNNIEHVKVIRIHTRVPVVAPERITNELIRSLKGKKPVYVLLHANHAHEFTQAAKDSCAALVDAGIPMLSQSVLLRGVNDSAEALESLMRTFVENRIKPHYLHHGDLARGTKHFRLPLKSAQSLLRTLRGKISGLCQPTYILDIPGGHGKIPVGPNYAAQANESWHVEDISGNLHSYKDIT